MTDDRKPDFEVEVDQEQTLQAIGDYCANRLASLPAGTYARTSMSLITNDPVGTFRIVFRAWGPAVVAAPAPGKVVGVVKDEDKA